MKPWMNIHLASLTGVAAAAALVLAGCAGMEGGGGKVMLTGAQEVPPVTTAATGSGTITVSEDKSVSGSIKTTGIDGTVVRRGRMVPSSSRSSKAATLGQFRRGQS